LGISNDKHYLLKWFDSETDRGIVLYATYNGGTARPSNQRIKVAVTSDITDPYNESLHLSSTLITTSSTLRNFSLVWYGSNLNVYHAGGLLDSLECYEKTDNEYNVRWRGFLEVDDDDDKLHPVVAPTVIMIERKTYEPEESQLLGCRVHGEDIYYP